MKSSTASRLMCPPATWTCAGVSSSADQMWARTRIVPSSFFHAQATAVASPEKEASTPTKTSAPLGDLLLGAAGGPARRGDPDVLGVRPLVQVQAAEGGLGGPR